MVFEKDKILPRNKHHEHQHTGGITGSSRIQYRGSYYQLKPSIRDRSKIDLRRIKVNGTDRENIGEVIAARIARPLLGESYAPEVSSVYHNGTWMGRKSRIEIVSKYLDNAVGNLDQYAIRPPRHASPELIAGVTNPESKIHALSSISSQPDAAKDWRRLPIDPTSLFARTLARAIAVSAIVGDHDVNPGNMIVIQDKAGPRGVGRIDFGHAFNDLLHTHAMFGGQLKDTANPVFDFFNRVTVAGAQLGGAPSKFWRDYEGFVPSEVLGLALIELGSAHEELQEGIQSAKEEILTLSRNLNEKNLDHLIDSLNEIHHAITGRNLKHQELKHNMIIQFFDEIERFVTNQAENAVKAGHMMQMQTKLNQAIDAFDGRSPLSLFIEHWQKRFEGAGLMDESDQLLYPWFRENSETSPFQGDLRGYILNRKSTLNNELTDDSSTEAADSPPPSPTDQYRQRIQTLKKGDEDNEEQNKLKK